MLAAPLEPQIADLSAALAEADRKLLAETERRRQAEARVEEAQRFELVGQLTAGLAHDFNNQLAAIIGSLELLARRVDVRHDQTAARLLTIAGDGARRSASLTGKLLAVTRRSAAEPRPIDIGDVARSMAELLRPSLSPGCRIDARPGSAVWPVMADPSAMSIAVLCLMLDARDALGGGGTLTVETANLPADNADRPQAPERVEQVAISVTARPVGTAHLPAVRLRLAAEIARQLGGSLLVDGCADQGAIARLLIPRAPDMPMEEASPAASQTVGYQPPETGRVISFASRP